MSDYKELQDEQIEHLNFTENAMHLMELAINLKKEGHCNLFVSYSPHVDAVTARCHPIDQEYGTDDETVFLHGICGSEHLTTAEQVNQVVQVMEDAYYGE